LPFEEKLLESFTRSSNLNYEFLDSVDIPQFNRTRMFKIKCFLSLFFIPICQHSVKYFENLVTMILSTFQKEQQSLL